MCVITHWELETTQVRKDGKCIQNRIKKKEADIHFNRVLLKVPRLRQMHLHQLSAHCRLYLFLSQIVFFFPLYFFPKRKTKNTIVLLYTIVNRELLSSRVLLFVDRGTLIRHTARGHESAALHNRCLWPPFVDVVGYRVKKREREDWRDSRFPRPSMTIFYVFCFQTGQSLLTNPPWNGVMAGQEQAEKRDGQTETPHPLM